MDNKNDEPATSGQNGVRWNEKTEAIKKKMDKLNKEKPGTVVLNRLLQCFCDEEITLACSVSVSYIVTFMSFYSPVNVLLQNPRQPDNCFNDGRNI